MSDAISAQGTKIYRSIDPLWPPSAPQGGPIAYVEIAELGDITPPALTRNDIETTVHNSQDDRYIVGIRRKGEMSFAINFIPTEASHDEADGLIQAYDDGTRDIYKIQYPDGSLWLFSGFLKELAPSAPVDDKLTADVTIRPTGRMQWL